MNDPILKSEKDKSMILDQLLTIGQAIQQEIAENPKKVYQLIVEAVCKTIEADCAVIYPYDPAFGEFYDVDNVADYGLYNELPVEEKADKKRRLAARVHQEGEIIRENIEQEDPRIHEKSPFITREGIKALMGLSLRIGDNILGILYVNYRKPHFFSEEEKRVIRLFGQQAALAVSNSWTSRLASIRAEAVTKLKVIGQTLTAIEDPSRTLNSVLVDIAHSAQEVLDADMVDLYQYIQAQNKFNLPPILVGDRRYPNLIATKVHDDDVVVRAVQARDPQYFQNTQETPLLIEEFRVPREGAPDQRFVVREEVVSSATIPLMAAGKTVGLMFVNYRTPQIFGPEQRDVIESFAAQAAIAIRNARLFQSEREQRRQSEMLRGTAQIVSSTLELKKVIGSVLEQLGEVIEYDSASVQLIEGDRRRLVGGRGFLLEDSPRELLRSVSQDSLVNKIVQKRRPLVLSDIKDEPLWDHIPQTANVNSWIGVPLVVQDQVIGLLTMDHRKAGYYTQESGETTAAFANHAALAIRNAELFSLEQDFQILHEVAHNLAKQPALKQIYQTAVQSALQTLHCVHSTIFVLDKQAGHLVAIDRAGAPEPASAVRPFKPGEGLAGTVVETGVSMRIDNAASDERFAKGKVALRSAARSIILAPIKIDDQVIGVISADKDETDGFSDHNLRVLEMLALDVGVAINAHRQLLQVSDQAQALIELNELAHQMVSIEESQDIRTLLEQVANSAYEVLKADLIDLYEYMQEKDEYRLPQISVGKRRRPMIPKKIYEDDAVFQLIQREDPLYMKRVQADSTLSGPYTFERKTQPTERFVIREGIQSVAVIPLRIGNETVGLMFANYRTPQTFAPEQKNLIELFANQAAIAIHNSHLFNESLRQKRELQIVDEIGKLLMSTLDSKEIPRLLLQQVVPLFGVEGASLWRVDQVGKSVECLFSLDREGKEESFSDTIRGITLRFSEGIVGTVAETGQSKIANRVQEESQWDKRVDLATGFEVSSRFFGVS